jgi:hypothetical protein
LAHTSWPATKAMGNRTLSIAPGAAGTSSCTAAYGQARAVTRGSRGKVPTRRGSVLPYSAAQLLAQGKHSRVHLSATVTLGADSSCPCLRYGGADQCFKLGRQDSDHGHFALAALTTCENNSVRATPAVAKRFPFAFPIVDRFYMAVLYGRAGRLAATNGGFRARAVLPHAHAGKETLTTTSVGQPWLVMARDGSCSCRAHEPSRAIILCLNL